VWIPRKGRLGGDVKSANQNEVRKKSRIKGIMKGFQKQKGKVARTKID